jgi:hypothetical protein
VDDANSDISMAPSSAGIVGLMSDFEDLTIPTHPLDLTIQACLPPSNDNLFERIKLEFKNGFSALLKANCTSNAATMVKLTVSNCFVGISVF